VKASNRLIAASLVLLVGCGGGPNSVNGQLGFNAVWSGFVSVSSGDLDIIITDRDLTSNCAVNAADGGGAPTFPFKDVVVTLSSGTIAPVAVGDFTIFTPDPGSPTTNVASVDLGAYTPPPLGAGYSVTTASATSGKVTISAADAHHVQGSFRVTMQPANGGAVAPGGPASVLSGSFDASPCGPQG
jgi:hypothetical protein